MFRRTLVLAVCTTPFLASLSGCLAADPVSPSRQFSGTTRKQVENAILAGAVQRGWTPTVVKPGEILCVYEKGSSIAAVNIYYDKDGFRMSMNKETTLLAREPGKVDKKYNQWVNNLAQTITRRLYESRIKG